LLYELQGYDAVDCSGVHMINLWMLHRGVGFWGSYRGSVHQYGGSGTL